MQTISALADSRPEDHITDSRLSRDLRQSINEITPKHYPIGAESGFLELPKRPDNKIAKQSSVTFRDAVYIHN